MRLQCHIDGLGLKIVHLWILNHFNVFIKIHEYANQINLHYLPQDKRDMSKLKNETRYSGLGPATVPI